MFGIDVVSALNHLLKKRDMKRAAVELLPNPLFIRLYNNQADATIQPAATGWAVSGDWSPLDRRVIYIPEPKEALRLTHLHPNPHKHVWEKYQLDGFVEVEPSDVVVETGGFIGQFTMFAGEISDRVISFEPDPRNSQILRKNTHNLDTVSVVEKAVLDTTGEIEFNVGNDGSQSSFLSVDDDCIRNVLSIPATRLDKFCEERDLDGIDFLKVEAEGAEPEIIESLGDERPSKLAVDCSPERRGNSPTKTIRSQLQNWGYKTRTRGELLFART